MNEKRYNIYYWTSTDSGITTNLAYSDVGDTVMSYLNLGFEITGIIDVEEDEFELPVAHNGCTCHCHTQPGVRHMSACCRPKREEK